MSPEGAEVAKALGRQAASLDVPLISGAARGVDQLAMNAAYEAGGSVISIPAHPMVHSHDGGGQTSSSRLRSADATDTGRELISQNQKRLKVTASVSEPLDLSGLGETATIQPDDLVLALWVLSTPTPPSKVVLPESLLIRRRLGRAGLVFAADRRGVPMEIAGRSVLVAEALGVGGVPRPLPLESYDLETSGRMRVVSRLEKRLPPRPDAMGRRYYWMDGLGVAVTHPERDFFDAHADQCVFELVDNVHRWALMDCAIAVVSATFGGGDQSHNRLQIVVADNGVGIVGSVSQKTEHTTSAGQMSFGNFAGDSRDGGMALRMIYDLLENAYESREVIGARGGHGLYTISQYVSRWHGTMNLISSVAESEVVHCGRRGGEGRWSDGRFVVEGIGGTLVHVTLDATTRSGQSRSSDTSDRRLVSV